MSIAVPDAEAPMAVPLIVRSPESMAAAGVVLRATLNFVASIVANGVVEEVSVTVPDPLLKAESVKTIVFPDATPPVKVLVVPSASVRVATTAGAVTETMLTEPAFVIAPLTVTVPALPLVTAPGV